jgi:hypothetical protein
VALTLRVFCFAPFTCSRVYIGVDLFSGCSAVGFVCCVFVLRYFRPFVFVTSPCGFAACFCPVPLCPCLVQPFCVHPVTCRWLKFAAYFLSVLLVLSSLVSVVVWWVYLVWIDACSRVPVAHLARSSKVRFLRGIPACFRVAAVSVVVWVV